MKRRYSWVWLLVVLGGCVGPTIIPSQNQLRSVREIYVVAMEPPPLILPSRYQSTVRTPSGIGPLIPIQAAGGSMPAVRGIGVFNTILIFIQLAEASQQTYDASRSSSTVLDTKGIWTPTVVLASEVSRQLTASGITTHVLPEVRPVPGVEFRGVTTTMENWMAPLRAHYNYMGPVQSYRDLASSSQSVLVLEVSILNYEVLFDKLLLQVTLKAIDPKSEQVVGRARSDNAWNMPSLEPVDQTLANDAARFKEAFFMTGSQLVSEALAELGLVSTVK